MKGIKPKFSFSKLFYNDRFVMLFSILVAFGIWLSISANSQETTLYNVTDIPVNLPDLSNDLIFFNKDTLHADVKISGNALVLANISSSDIYVTAKDASHITSPGRYNISLTAKKMGIMTDYSFEPSADQAVSPTAIEVYVDRYAEKEIALMDRIGVGQLADDCYASTTILAQQTVKVSGAESVINNIAAAAAVYDFKDTISSTTTVEAKVVLLDAAGNTIDSEYVKKDIETVFATVPILRIMNINIVPNIINAPASFKLNTEDVTIEPSVIQVAVPDDATETISEISTSEIDLSTVTPTNNSFEVELNIPSGFKNLNQITTARVEFDKTKLSGKKLTLTNFTVINANTDRRAAVSTKSVDIMLYGDTDQINSITSANITAVVDMSNKSTLSGFVEMPVEININSKYSFCWVFGSYQVDVNITDANSITENSDSNMISDNSG